MNKHALAFVRRLGIADEMARQVFLLLAERTDAPPPPYAPDEAPEIMGLELRDAEIPTLAQRVGLDAEGFREQLRGLKQHVRMDVLEHSDGVWEIVYGPLYTRPPKPRPSEPDLSRGGPHPFWAPGWEKYSIWGYESDPSGQTHLYAQLIANADGPDAEPRVWITPPSHVVHDVDGLADAIATAIAPFEPVSVPAVVVKRWLTTPPVSWG